MIQGLGDELMSEFSKGMRSTKSETIDYSPSANSNEYAQYGEELLMNYAKSLVDHHKRNVDPDAIETLVRRIEFTPDWLNSVDDHRPVFAEITKGVDDSLAVETPSEVAYELRIQALRYSSPELTVESDSSAESGNLGASRCERFLDSEIIAIYW